MTERREENTAGRGLLARRNRRVAAIAGLAAAGMVGMAYAAVPLYQIFCQVTGYGGTTQSAEAASATTIDRDITIRFDANTARNMGWSFRPAQREVTLKVGENGLAYYEARSLVSRRTAGTATFNVTPVQAGAYFTKVDCFCFTEQVLDPGQTAQMPVSFFVDPAIADDPELDSVSTITLSYTFFPSEVDELADAGTAATDGKAKLN